MTQPEFAIIAAAVIHVLVRLSKAGKLAPLFPPRFRPWLAVALGALTVMVDRLVIGATLEDSVVAGCVAAGAAIAGHELLVESLLGGREVGK